VGEAAMNNLNAVGIRLKMRLLERAAFYAAWQEKKLRGLFLTAVGNSGNAASRVEAFIYSRGASAYGGYPTSTSCSSSRPTSATPPSARRCSIASRS
jgi:peptide/nickel transport system substrate-binding protein